MVEDTTERKQLEEQLLQSQKMEAVGQLAGGIAHDFNNLLTAIIGFAHLGSFKVHEDHPVARYFKDIQTSSERAARLTRQLLTFSHSDITDPVNLDLNEIIAETDRMLRPIIGENIELNTLLSPDLGMIKIDPTHVEQLLVNLAVNSSDAMPDGGKLWIETTRQTIDDISKFAQADLPPGDYVVLTVRDTGTGMTDEVKSKIFEPFFTTKDIGKGTGLGLATSYGIVTKAGGHIEVGTQLGSGTSFYIYFPMVDGSVTTDAQIENKLEDVAVGHETILLVEDEALIREACAIALRYYGYNVLEASNGTEAVRIVETHLESGIDLLMTDVVMPFMGGVELSKQVVDTIPGIKVLFASGYSDDQALRDGLITKNHHFIQKPFTPAVLTTSVRQILDS
jgi:two-component system cell cycle sensor histidine kinase/response regulator CckA